MKYYKMDLTVLGNIYAVGVNRNRNKITIVHKLSDGISISKRPASKAFILDIIHDLIEIEKVEFLLLQSKVIELL